MTTISAVLAISLRIAIGIPLLAEEGWREAPGWSVRETLRSDHPVYAASPLTAGASTPPLRGGEYRLLMRFRTSYGGKRPAAEDAANKMASARTCLGRCDRVRVVHVVDACRRFPRQGPIEGNTIPVC